MSGARSVLAAASVAAFAAIFGAACGPAASEPVNSTAAPVPAPAQTVPPHGDHNPHHGGVVLMKGDLHYEVVLDPAGRAHQVYFTDAVRADLPAAYASDVALTLKRAGEPDELVPLQIDSTGESWIGSSRPIVNAAATTVRIAFTVGQEPYWIDVPFPAR